MSKVVSAFYMAFISIVVGSIQMAFFLYDGVSCSDGTSSLLDGILFFMPFQFVFVFLLSLVRKNIIYYLIMFLIFIFWIYVNEHEFENRHACWSTFSNIEIIKAVLLKSSYTCSICIFVYYFLTRKYLKK